MAEQGTGTGEDSQGGLLSAREGYGPLLQRDYWALIRDCHRSPSEVMALVVAHFPEFSPRELADFERTDGRRAPLELGDELWVRIRGAGRACVRVVHQDAQSLTLATRPGHPEAGRITFGAYRNGRGDVIFHIRSRARSSSQVKYVGFLGVGEAMQTNTWTDFVNAVAVTVGEGVIGFIHADTQQLDEARESADEVSGPTFLARGDEAHD